MTDVSANQAREQLLALLADTIVAAAELKDILQLERQALEQEDLHAVEVAVETKTTLVAKLSDLDDRRSELCSAWGFERGESQMQRVIDWCDDRNAVEHRWQHLLLLATESSTLNLTNGAIIRLRQQQFESSISLLRGRTPRVDTYGQHGTGTGDYDRQSLGQA